MKHIKQLLFITLGLERYLTVVRKAYFPVFKTGILKSNPIYGWHYFVKNLVKRGDVVIDIGANMGYYSAVFSALAGDNGKVYSIEPVAPLVKQLNKQVKRKKNVTILPFALGNEEKEQVFLSMPEGFHGTDYFHHGFFCVRPDKPLRDEKLVFTAAMHKGSNAFAELPRIDYIKCDVEGSEKVILADLEPLLARHQPMVQVEIREKHFLDLVDFFKDLGYQAFKLEQEKLFYLEKLPASHQTRFDTLFVHPRHFGRIAPFIKKNEVKEMLPQPVKQPYLQANP